MTETADVQAEILKLARLLSRDPGELGFLIDVPSEDIRRLREQVTDLLFDAHGQALGRLAAASRLLPVSLIAMIAERALGPVLTALIAGLLEPSRAVDVAAKLPTGFLAEVAIHIDPRRASEVIAGMPAAQIAQVTGELARRAEFVTIGRFVGRLGPEAATAAVEAMDATTVLQVSFVAEDKDRLEHLIGVLDGDRLAELLDAAARAGLWDELIDLLGRLPEPWRGRYLELAAARGAIGGGAQTARQAP
jgi:hypothetical protein